MPPKGTLCLLRGFPGVHHSGGGGLLDALGDTALTSSASWPRFGFLLVSFWSRFGFVLVSFWSRFGFVLVSFWPRFGSSFWFPFKLLLVHPGPAVCAERLNKKHSHVLSWWRTPEDKWRLQGLLRIQPLPLVHAVPSFAIKIATHNCTRVPGEAAAPRTMLLSYTVRNILFGTPVRSKC